MNACDRFQSLMLEHLYGLLEPGEGRELERHLADCPDCRRDLARAEGQQRLLSAAAKLEFAEVTFQPPAESPPADVIPFPRRSPARSSPALRWAVAAGIVLLVGGLTIPGLLTSRERDRLDQARARLDQIKTEAESLDQGFQERLARADKDVKETGAKIQ